MAVLIWNRGFKGDKNKPEEFVNFAYLLKGAAESSDGKFSFAGTKYWTVSGGTSDTFDSGANKPESSAYWKAARDTDESTGIQRSTFETRATNQKTSAMYISTIASYYAQLIRDYRGDVIGAVFIEQ